MPRRPYLPLVLLMLAAACSSPEDVAEETGVAARAGAEQASTSASASAASAEGKRVEEDTPLYQFEYSYPGAAAKITPLANWFESQIAERKAGLTSEAEESRADAETGGFAYHPHSFAQDWRVVADLPGYLSLSGLFTTYSGGAHGMYGMDSFVWDKDAGKRLESLALFRSAAALDRALGGKLCAALNREREKRRGEPVPANSDDMFNQCVGIDETTLLLGSSNGRTFDRLGVWIGPYVAGPYAEGSFELNFPVDAAVLGAVKPDYRETFTARR